MVSVEDIVHDPTMSSTLTTILAFPFSGTLYQPSVMMRSHKSGSVDACVYFTDLVWFTKLCVVSTRVL